MLILFRFDDILLNSTWFKQCTFCAVHRGRHRSLWFLELCSRSFTTMHVSCGRYAMFFLWVTHKGCNLASQCIFYSSSRLKAPLFSGWFCKVLQNMFGGGCLSACCSRSWLTFAQCAKWFSTWSIFVMSWNELLPDSITLGNKQRCMRSLDHFVSACKGQGHHYSMILQLTCTAASMLCW